MRAKLQKFFWMIFYVTIVSKKFFGVIVYFVKFIWVLKQNIMSVFFVKNHFDQILTETQL